MRHERGLANAPPVLAFMCAYLAPVYGHLANKNDEITPP
jgi:hypothetical protein